MKNKQKIIEKFHQEQALIYQLMIFILRGRCVSIIQCQTESEKCCPDSSGRFHYCSSERFC